jgi:hypothetical protein
MENKGAKNRSCSYSCGRPADHESFGCESHRSAELVEFAWSDIRGRLSTFLLEYSLGGCRLDSDFTVGVAGLSLGSR